MYFTESYGGTSCTPQNPEDPNRGCLGMTGIVIVIILYGVLMLCSCSTASKVQTSVSSVDSLTTIVNATTEKHSIDSVSTAQKQIQWHRDSTFTDITFTEAETINEVITENIDSLGRVTNRVINRTTQRNTNNRDNTVSVSEGLTASEQLAVYLSYLDSIANANYYHGQVHHADSLSNIQQPAGRKQLPWWIRLAYFISDLLKYAVLAFLIVGIGTLVYKYIRCK